MSPERLLHLPENLQPLLLDIHRLLQLHVSDAYLVGGTVRDVLLGRQPRDIDLAVAGDATGVGDALARELGGSAFTMSEERGQVRVVLPDRGLHIDLQPLHGSVEENLRQRDYTIDAMAASLGEAIDGPTAVIDPTGGLADLESRRLCAVSEEAFRQDPLRPLRGVRLAAELGLAIEPETAALIRRYAAGVSAAAAERQRDELVRVVDTDRAADGLRMLEDYGLLEVLLPDTAEMRGVGQPKEHYWDVWNHSLQTVAALDQLLGNGEPVEEPWRTLWGWLWGELAWMKDDLRSYLDEPIAADHRRIAIIKLAGLLHDIAKPQTKTTDETGRIRFFGHPDQGAEKAAAMLRRLRFSSREAEFVATMIDAHLRPVQLGEQGPPTRRALYRFFRDCGDAAPAVLLISLADHLGSVGPRLNLAGWRSHVGLINYILTEEKRDDSLVRPIRLVSGHDLMDELGLAPGPQVGRLLETIEEAQAAGEVTTREEALALARKEMKTVKQPEGNRAQSEHK